MAGNPNTIVGHFSFCFFAANHSPQAIGLVIESQGTYRKDNHRESEIRVFGSSHSIFSA
jgi:hypothetical protein